MTENGEMDFEADDGTARCQRECWAVSTVTLVEAFYTGHPELTVQVSA